MKLLQQLLLQSGVKCSGHSCAVWTNLISSPLPHLQLWASLIRRVDDDVIISVVVNCLLDASKSYFKQSHVDTEQQQQQQEKHQAGAGPGLETGAGVVVGAELPSDIRQRCGHQVQNVLGSGT